MLFAVPLPSHLAAADRDQEKISLEDHIRGNVPSEEEIDVFLHEMSWAQFDPDVGYILGNYMPRDGMDGSSTPNRFLIAIPIKRSSISKGIFRTARPTSTK
jgi:hypothetical protein